MSVVDARLVDEGDGDALVALATANHGVLESSFEHTLATGALFAIGFMAAGVALLLLAGLHTKWTVRRKRKRVAPKSDTVKLDEMTDAQIRGRIISASANLDLWLRAAAVRDIRVDGSLLQVDGAAGKRPQFRIRVHDSGGGFAEWPQGSADGKVFF